MATRKPQRMDAAPFSVQRAPRRTTLGTEPEGPAGGGTAGGVRLTGRGGILLITAVSLVGALIGHMAGATLVSGIGFTAACVAAALLVRPTDLLSLTVSPPLAYFVAALLAEVAVTLGQEGFSRAVAVGMATRLADVAPSLFLGTALVLVIAVFRGLPGNIRDFSDEVNGRSPRSATPEEPHRTQ